MSETFWHEGPMPEIPFHGIVTLCRFWELQKDIYPEAKFAYIGDQVVDLENFDEEILERAHDVFENYSPDMKYSETVCISDYSPANLWVSKRDATNQLTEWWEELDSKHNRFIEDGDDPVPTDRFYKAGLEFLKVFLEELRNETPLAERLCSMTITMSFDEWKRLEDE